MPAKTTKRTYNSSRRILQAAETRAEVLRAATKLFGESGWTGTTLAAIAEEAGVSVETIYKGFGSKKALLGEALDVAVVGDTEPIPFVERPEFAMLGEGTREERTARGIANLFDQLQRSAGVWQAIVEAASSDPAVDEWRLDIEERRRIDVRRSIERVLDREVDDSLLSVLWVLYSSETYRKLVIDSGMSRAEYERVLVDASLRLTDS